MMMVVHLNPFSPSSDLVFDQTTPTGGDMGAHVWAPAYLRDHLLPHFQLSGWSMDWYGGLPIYRFYMVVPGAGHRGPRRDPPVRGGVQARGDLRAAALPDRLLGVRPARRLPLPDPRAVRDRGALLPARRELPDLRRQREVDDGGGVLVLDRAVAGDARARPARRRAADRQVPRLGGDRAVAGRGLARHRADLRRRRRDHPVPRRGSTAQRFVYAITTGDHDPAAVGVVGRPVPVRSRST